MKKRFKKAVLKALEQTRISDPGLLTETDIRPLPPIVRKYLRFTGCLGKEKVQNFRAVFRGGIRSRSSDAFMPLISVQYNFIENPTRLFYIVARKKGIPAVGIHLYEDRKAQMIIKLLGLFTVADAKGPEMDQGETVTLFNDMCFMAPASLIDQRISWKEMDERTVEARYTHGPISISAILSFDDEGRLVNFISHDRFETTDGKRYDNYPWMTPVTGYRIIDGYHLPSSAQLIYRHPGEDFCYGEFSLADIRYNCREYF